MTITKVGQAADGQTLRIGFACGGQRFNVVAETLARIPQCLFAQITHHSKRMKNPINYFGQKRLHYPCVMHDNGDAV